MKQIFACAVVLLVLALMAIAQTKLEGVLLTAADSEKLQKAVEVLNRQQTEFELARARYQAAISDFQRVKAEIIGDHGLAPTKHDLSQDGKSIVPLPPAAPAAKKEP